MDEESLPTKDAEYLCSLKICKRDRDEEKHDKAQDGSHRERPVPEEEGHEEEQKVDKLVWQQQNCKEVRRELPE